jgi:predicted cupin superfamily sugar epimerase
MDPDAEWLIARFAMAPIPVEGGWFSQTWRSSIVASSALPAASAGVPGGEGRPEGTAILALFCPVPEGFSALHRLPTTEVWHFCGGDPFNLLLLHGDGTSSDVVLGPDPRVGHDVQFPVPPATWMGGEVAPGGRFSLVGCTMAPGFTSEGFEAGVRETLMTLYPERAGLVDRLTRSNEG